MVLSMFTKIVHLSLPRTFKIFSSPQKCHTCYQSLPILPSPCPGQPLAYFRCPHNCLFWPFHLGGIFQYLSFCDALVEPFQPLLCTLPPHSFFSNASALGLLPPSSSCLGHLIPPKGFGSSAEGSDLHLQPRAQLDSWSLYPLPPGHLSLIN